MTRYDLRVAVPGTSRSERLDRILYIANSLTDNAPSCRKVKLGPLNDLLQIAATEGIRLTYLDLSCTQAVRSVYFCHDEVPYIMLDEALKRNPTEHVAALAEEVGRHFARKAVSSKNKDHVGEEVAALRWAIHFLSTGPLAS